MVEWKRFDGYEIKYDTDSYTFLLERNSYEFKKAKKQFKEKYPPLCSKCGQGYDLEIDHIIPLSLHGPQKISNLQWLCMSCHGKKTSDDTAVIKQLVRQKLIQPTTQGGIVYTTSEKLHEKYQMLLNQLYNTPKTSFPSNLATIQEREHVLYGSSSGFWSITATEKGKCVHQVLRKQLKRNPVDCLLCNDNRAVDFYRYLPSDLGGAKDKAENFISLCKSCRKKFNEANRYARKELRKDGIIEGRSWSRIVHTANERPGHRSELMDVQRRFLDLRDDLLGIDFER